MRRIFPLAVIALSTCPAAADADVCLSGTPEYLGSFNWCDAFDDIRLAFNDQDYVLLLDNAPQLGGANGIGPTARFGIEVAPRKESKTWPSANQITLVASALTKRVCRGGGLRDFVSAGGRVVFDLFAISQAQEHPLDMGVEAQRLVSSITVATCEAN